MNRVLLVIEDSDEDFEAFRRSIRHCINLPQIHRCTDGDEAMDFLQNTGAYVNAAKSPVPHLILLDLNLPGTDGREVLKQIKREPILQSTPVVIFTTSSNSKDIEYCYQKGASGYIVKPINIQTLGRSLLIFLEYWLEINTLPTTHLVNC